MSYIFTFEGEVVHEDDQEITYTSEKRQITIYSEDSSFIGTHEITLTAYLTNYSSVKSIAATSTFEIFDACPDPLSVMNPGQSSPNDYYYTSNTPSLSFTLTPFIVNPTACTSNIVYSCSVISGSRTDLCSITDG